MGERCFFHQDRDAVQWREGVYFGEPVRVCLCQECVTAIVKEGLDHNFYSLHPLEIVFMQRFDVEEFGF
jgi:hypothetical protein